MSSSIAVLFVLMFILLAGSIVAAILVGIRTRRKNEEKTQTMAATAAALGWTFWGPANQLVDGWPCAPFHRGEGRRVDNCVEGTHRGVPFLAFEYHYYTESTSTDSEGHSQTTRTNYTFDVAVLRLGANIPNLNLQPEGAFARMVDAVTGNDIDLEWDVFNRAYRLSCPDRKFAFDTFNARTMEYLVQRGQVTFDFAAGDAVISQSSRGFDPTIWGPGDPAWPLEQSPAPLDTLLVVLQGIPDFVWQERGGRPAGLAGALR